MDIRELINKNIKEIPYEGQEVDKEGIKLLMCNLLKGMISFSQSFKKTSKGYLKDGKYHSRDEIVQLFLKQ